MVDTNELVTAPYKTLSDSELRFLPVTALLGVTDDMAAALDRLGIKTILDLAASRVFAQAGNVLASIGLAADEFPGDLLKEEVPAADLSDAETLAPDRLHGLDDAVAQALSQTLGTATIRAFALWSPYRAARAIGGRAGLETDDEEDPAAARLRPIIGQFPTENSYYSTLIMLGSEGQPQLDPMTDPLSLDRLLGQNAAFGTPAIGAIATYVQSWISQGVTLGHMLHSLALAPGEATRIAVIDWSRTTSARVTDDIGETEALSSSQTHARAISEIQSGVANGMQVGGSSSDATSTSTSEAEAAAAAGGFGLALGPLVVGGAGGGTQNYQSATTTTNANSSSWTMGKRDIVSTMEQTVNDRTEQQANVVRNRRASSVREVSQSEHEQISTRIVANYNHMHALTIQYYEVVQAYMVTARLHAFDRAIFLPFSLLDFSGPNAANLVARFRRQLILGALTARARSLLLDDRGVVELRGSVRVELPALTEELATSAGAVADATLGTVGTGVPASVPTGPSATGSLAAEALVNRRVILRRKIVSNRPGALIETTDGETVLEAVSFEDIRIDVVRLDRDGVPSDQTTFPISRQTAQAELPSGLLLREITGGFVRRIQAEDTSGTMVLHLRTAGQGREVRVPIGLSDSMAMQRVLYVTADATDRRAELMQHLQTNQVHYTQAVFTNLDNPALIQLLAGLSFQGRALTEQIEPRVQAVIGNYLILPAPVNMDEEVAISGDTKSWSEHMADRDIDFEKIDRRLISVPTGGVFAEAVLGRSNSAEKLDITRFWNWQDSPIPLTPPEIAPISAASRGENETLTPGQLSAPILNISNPTSLPDPAGLGAILSALSDGDTFRNMSGLDGTQGLAGSISSGTLTAATEAGKLASQNFGTAANLAGNLAMAAMGLPKNNSTAGMSAEGARVNQGRDMDKRGVSVPGGRGGSGSSGGGTGTDGGGTSTGRSRQMTSSREAAYADHGALGYSPGGLGALAKRVGELGDGQFQNAVFGVEDVQKANEIAPHWRNLLRFEVPQNIVEALARRDMSVQRLHDGVGNLSLDIYPVLISQFPLVDGNRLNARGLMEHVRKDLNNFVNNFIFIDNFFANFLPYAEENPDDPNPEGTSDSLRWLSVDATQTVFDIDIPGDNGAVVCSAHDETGWIFTTLKAPDPGEHPLAGHRGFEIREVEPGSGVHVFYTMGVDRKMKIAQDPLWLSEFSQKKLWGGFQSKVTDFVNANGGQAEIMGREVESIDWKIVRITMGLTSIT